MHLTIAKAESYKSTGTRQAIVLGAVKKEFSSLNKFQFLVHISEVNVTSALNF